jgi:hypothetical protein
VGSSLTSTAGGRDVPEMRGSPRGGSADGERSPSCGQEPLDARGCAGARRRRLASGRGGQACGAGGPAARLDAPAPSTPRRSRQRFDGYRHGGPPAELGSRGPSI